MKDLTVDLYREWHIWFKCLGKVFVLTGTSSTGKTTTLKRFDNFYNVISQDNVYDKMLIKYYCENTKSMILAQQFLSKNDLLCTIYGFKIKTVFTAGEKVIIQALRREITSSPPFHPSELELCDQMYDHSKQFIFCGQNVILDVVALEQRIQVLSYSFRHYPMQVGLLYASLEHTIERCFQRNVLSFKHHEFHNQRDYGMILWQYQAFFDFRQKKDLSKSNCYLEKIDIHAIKKLLKVTQFLQKSLVKSKEPFIWDSSFLNLEVISKTQELANSLWDKLNSDGSISIYVAPLANYDFIIISDVRDVKLETISFAGTSDTVEEFY